MTMLVVEPKMPTGLRAVATLFALGLCVTLSSCGDNGSALTPEAASEITLATAI